MKSLIIYAHPKTEGFCSFILQTVAKELKKKDHKTEVIDLYRLNYDTYLHEDEHYTAGNREVSSQNRRFQEKIKEADQLIFIYPIWWYSMPAALKGFFDRVFTPRFAFLYEKTLPKGLLKGKKTIVFHTTGGPIAYYMITGNLPKRNIQDLLKFCGISPKIIQFGNAKDLTDSRKRSISKKVKAALK